MSLSDSLADKQSGSNIVNEKFVVASSDGSHVEVPREDYENIVSVGNAAMEKYVDSVKREAERAAREQLDSDMKQAQEAYDAAVKSGLPEIVAVGIARNYSPGFEVKKDAVAKK